MTTTLQYNRGYWVLKVDGYIVAVKKVLRDALVLTNHKLIKR